MGAKIDQKSIKKWHPRWNASWHRFLNDFVGFGVPSWEAIKNRIEKTMQKTKPFGTRLGPSSGCQGRRDVLRPSPTGPGATRRAGNPPRRPPGPPPFRAKIPVKKETVLDVLTRLGPEARRISFSIRGQLAEPPQRPLGQARVLATGSEMTPWNSHARSTESAEHIWLDISIQPVSKKTNWQERYTSWV